MVRKVKLSEEELRYVIWDAIEELEPAQDTQLEIWDEARDAMNLAVKRAFSQYGRKKLRKVL